MKFLKKAQVPGKPWKEDWSDIQTPESVGNSIKKVREQGLSDDEHDVIDRNIEKLKRKTDKKSKLGPISDADFDDLLDQASYEIYNTVADNNEQPDNSKMRASKITQEVAAIYRGLLEGKSRAVLRRKGRRGDLPETKSLSKVIMNNHNNMKMLIKAINKLQGMIPEHITVAAMENEEDYKKIIDKLKQMPAYDPNNDEIDFDATISSLPKKDWHSYALGLVEEGVRARGNGKYTNRFAKESNKENAQAYGYTSHENRDPIDYDDLDLVIEHTRNILDPLGGGLLKPETNKKRRQERKEERDSIPAQKRAAEQATKMTNERRGQGRNYGKRKRKHENKEKNQTKKFKFLKRSNNE